MSIGTYKRLEQYQMCLLKKHLKSNANMDLFNDEASHRVPNDDQRLIFCLIFTGERSISGVWKYHLLYNLPLNDSISQEGHLQMSKCDFLRHLCTCLHYTQRS